MPGTQKAVLTFRLELGQLCCRDVTLCAPKIPCEWLSNISQIYCPTPHIHTEFEPFTSCVITLVQYISYVESCYTKFGVSLQNWISKRQFRWQRLLQQKHWQNAHLYLDILLHNSMQTNLGLSWGFSSENHIQTACESIVWTCFFCCLNTASGRFDNGFK